MGYPWSGVRRRRPSTISNVFYSETAWPIKVKEGRALSPFFGPPWKPKIKIYFTTLFLDCFIRLMIQVFLFHIDFTSTVAMVTENGRQNRLKSKKCHFELKSGGLTGKLI